MDALLPLMSFAFMSSITPGPNNLMLSASGVAFGMQKTLPHILGVVLGFAFLLALCGSGVGAFMVEFPPAAIALKLLGSVYLLYLAWAMRNAFAVKAQRAGARPFSFVQAFLFQFANPKAWVMGLTAASVFLPQLGVGWAALLTLCVVFAAVGTPCIVLWTALGVTARRFLAGPRAQAACGAAIFALMVITVIAIWL
jgi:threonine/homoserine/homoserine lactone efflux protein